MAQCLAYTNNFYSQNIPRTQRLSPSSQSKANPEDWPLFRITGFEQSRLTELRVGICIERQAELLQFPRKVEPIINM